MPDVRKRVGTLSAVLGGMGVAMVAVVLQDLQARDAAEDVRALDLLRAADRAGDPKDLAGDPRVHVAAKTELQRAYPDAWESHRKLRETLVEKLGVGAFPIMGKGGPRPPGDEVPFSLLFIRSRRTAPPPATDATPSADLSTAIERLAALTAATDVDVALMPQDPSSLDVVTRAPTDAGAERVQMRSTALDASGQIVVTWAPLFQMMVQMSPDAMVRTTSVTPPVRQVPMPSLWELSDHKRPTVDALRALAGDAARLDRLRRRYGALATDDAVRTASEAIAAAAETVSLMGLGIGPDRAAWLVLALEALALVGILLTLRDAAKAGEPLFAERSGDGFVDVFLDRPWGRAALWVAAPAAAPVVFALGRASPLETSAVACAALVVLVLGVAALGRAAK